MFGASKSKIPVIITFSDRTTLHCDLPPGSTPGILSAISNENVWLEAWVEGKRKFYLRQHMISIEADGEKQTKLDEAAQSAIA